MKIKKYLKLWLIFLKNSFIKEFGNPLNITISHLAVIGWMLSVVIFYRVIFEHVEAISGWTWGETLILIGTYFTIDGLIYTLFYWNMLKLKNFAKNKNLDIIILKPVNSQFLISTQEIQASMYIQFVATIVFIIVGVNINDIDVPLLNYILYVFYLIIATAISYSVWFISVCSIFWIKNVDTIIHFFGEIFNFAVYPSQIYSGVLKYIFNAIIPLALMVTIPSEIITGDTNLRKLTLTLITAIVFIVLSRVIWKLGLTKYTRG